MRTRTIYAAMREAASILHGPVDFDAEPRGLNHRGDQYRKFERELLRRMDERDADVGPAKAYRALERLWPIYRDAGNNPQERAAYIDRLQRELAEARAYISTIIGAPGEGE